MSGCMHDEAKTLVATTVLHQHADVTWKCVRWRRSTARGGGGAHNCRCHAQRAGGRQATSCCCHSSQKHRLRPHELFHRQQTARGATLGTSLGVQTPALFPIKTFVVSILYIMKGGLCLGGVWVIPRDRYLASILPEANTLDAYGLNKPAFTACKNNILKA